MSVLFFWGKFVYVTEKSSMLAKEYNSSIAVGGCLTLAPETFLLRTFCRVFSDILSFSSTLLSLTELTLVFVFPLQLTVVLFFLSEEFFLLVQISLLLLTVSS